MIATVAGGRALPTEIAEQIVDRTDGVPLFVEELTKAVIESGTLTDAGDRFTAAGPIAALAIPTTLQASLLARLDRLAPVREVAQIGAALGRQFSHELIAAVAPIPRPQLDDALTQLVSAELIYRRGKPPDAEYTFKHALVQDAAYSTLLRSRRAATARSDHRGSRRPVPRYRDRAAGTAGSALRASRFDREGDRLLGRCGPASDLSFSDDRSCFTTLEGTRPAVDNA